MALASVQGSAEVSAYAADGYLLEIYQQVAETTRPVATPRYARLAGFLAFVGVVTAFWPCFHGPSGTVTLLFTDVEGSTLLVQALGAGYQYALDGHRRHESGRSARTEALADTAASIYLASIGFFAFAVAIGTALLLLR
jgi:hypothetical protein